MRKIGFILLIAVLTFALSAVVSAEGVKVSLTSGTAYKGEEIVVKVNMDENPGFIASVVTVEYDSDALTLKSVKDFELLGTNNHSDNLSDDVYYLSWFNPLSREDYSATGTVAELTFAVDENASAGSYEVAVEVVQMYNTNLQSIEVASKTDAVINVLEIEYETTEDDVTVTGIKGGTPEILEIPETLGGKTVTSIGNDAFKDCALIKEIKMPETIKAIGNNAFSGCVGLEKVELPSSLESIGASAFVATALYEDEDNWTDGVLYIDNYLIEVQGEDITEVEIKEGTVLLASGSFEGCTALSDLIIPKSVKFVNYGAFKGIESLETVTYSGRRDDWETIEIAEENEALINANIICTVTSIPGDVTGDGVVNRNDLLRLAKHFSGFTVEIDEEASDVTGDGVLTRGDLLRLAKYFSGFDVELGK